MSPEAFGVVVFGFLGILSWFAVDHWREFNRVERQIRDQQRELEQRIKNGCRQG